MPTGDANWAAFPEPDGGAAGGGAEPSSGADTWGTFSAATVTAVPDDVDDDEFGDFEDVPSISVSVPKVTADWFCSEVFQLCIYTKRRNVKLNIESNNNVN